MSIQNVNIHDGFEDHAHRNVSVWHPFPEMMRFLVTLCDFNGRHHAALCFDLHGFCAPGEPGTGRRASSRQSMPTNLRSRSSVAFGGDRRDSSGAGTPEATAIMCRRRVASDSWARIEISPKRPESALRSWSSFISCSVSIACRSIGNANRHLPQHIHALERTCIATACRLDDNDRQTIVNEPAALRIRTPEDQQTGRAFCERTPDDAMEAMSSSWGRT